MSGNSNPAVYLPLIAPPPIGTDPEPYYQALGASVTATASGSQQGVSLQVNAVTLADLFAMLDGDVHYVPAGQPLPVSGDASPVGGSLVLEVNARAMLLQYGQRWPATCTAIVQYCGVDSQEVQGAFATRVGALPAKIKKAAWKLAHGGAEPPPQTDLSAYYLTRFMAGSACVGVKAGDRIGRAAFLGLMFGFELRCVNSLISPLFESPTALIRWAVIPQPPLVDRWAGHPLIEGVETLPDTVMPTVWELPPEGISEDDITIKNGQLYGPGATKSFGYVSAPGGWYGGECPVSGLIAALPNLTATLSDSVLRIFAEISGNEGHLDAFNTHDNSFLSFGFFQWTSGQGNDAGELPGLLARYKDAYPTFFQEYFGVYGLDVDAPATPNVLRVGRFLVDGVQLNTAAQKAELREHIWAYRFWRAGHSHSLGETELRHARERIDILRAINVPEVGQPISATVTSEYGIALLLDEHVNRPAHLSGAGSTINRAIMQQPPGLPPDPADWTTAHETAILKTYVTLRGKTMTKGPTRAARAQTSKAQNRLSGARLSFAP